MQRVVVLASLVILAPTAHLSVVAQSGAAAPQDLLITRLGPAAATLYIADADGRNERPLLERLERSDLDYNPSLSADGEWVVFTSERNGSADIYRVRSNRTQLERLTDDAAYDDQAALSPDGTQVAFVSTRGTRTTEIWVLDLETGATRNVTSAAGGDFRPSWSPNGEWIAFSSDRGTSLERPAPAWEQLQRTSIYLVRSDGTGTQRLTSGERSAGAPKWSPDGSRVLFYELEVMDTLAARVGLPGVSSQIVSVDLTDGTRQQHTSGPGLKVSPQYLADNEIGYLQKSGNTLGIMYASGHQATAGVERSPSWSSAGTRVVYERGSVATQRRIPAWHEHFSLDDDYTLRQSDNFFPSYSPDGTWLAASEPVAALTGLGEIAITVTRADGTSPTRVFYEKGAVAMAPRWSPDASWLIFGVGAAFETRDAPARIVMTRSDGTETRTVATGVGAGFPSFSPDGTRIVYRVWGAAPDERGLRVLTLDTGDVQVLTSTDYDTFPEWSPTDDLIVFTSFRNNEFDLYSVRPDGSKLRQLTTTPGNDAHSSFSFDGRRLMFSSGRYGFKDESALMDGQPQPYGEIIVMNADGSDQQPLTDNQWEDGPGAWPPPQ
jgi:Tol biopolymer transport system component